MTLTPLYDPKNWPMRVAGLMSGSGTNLRKIIEHERLQEKSPYKIVAIFSNSKGSKAEEIGAEYHIPVVVMTLNDFSIANGQSPISRELREKYPDARKEYEQVREGFDREIVNLLSPYGATAAAYAGYMMIANRPLIDAFLGINVHPADLTVKNPDGSRKYTGDHAVRDAILAGEKHIRSTTHIIEPEVDQGRILMVSAPLEVVLGAEFDSSDPDIVKKASSMNQDRLKEAGDWVIFPKTLSFVAEGRYAQDEKGNLYFDSKPIPAGLRMEDIR